MGHVFRKDKYALLQVIMEGKIECRKGLGGKENSRFKNLLNWFQKLQP